MARPSRCRRVCAEPNCRGFVPQSKRSGGEVVLTVDEYEVIRLIDYEKRTHEQCAAQMEVSRTTVTEIYERARFKIADSLVNGKALSISGGHYRVCGGERGRCCSQNCIWKKTTTDKMGGFTMRIAVTYENGQVFQHFGHTEQMKIYDVENGQITAQQVVSTNGSGHGALAGFLAAQKVDTLICGGIGGGAQQALAQAGIKLYGGVSGDADEAVKALISGGLNYDANVRCDHHDHEHGEGHDCGHNCGGHEHGHHHEHGGCGHCGGGK